MWLTLSVNDSFLIEAYIDALDGVHADGKGQHYYWKRFFLCSVHEAKAGIQELYRSRADRRIRWSVSSTLGKELFIRARLYYWTCNCLAR